MVWESHDNIEKVQKRIDYIMSGCKCKTGCATRRCKCVKDCQKCGPGCRCILCENVHRETTTSIAHEHSDEEDEDYSSSYDTEPEDEYIGKDKDTENILDTVFGH